MLPSHKDVRALIVSLLVVPTAFLAMMCLGVLIFAVLYIIGGIACLLAACPPLLLIYVVCIIQFFGATF